MESNDGSLEMPKFDIRTAMDGRCINIRIPCFESYVTNPRQTYADFETQHDSDKVVMGKAYSYDYYSSGEAVDFTRPQPLSNKTKNLSYDDQTVALDLSMSRNGKSSGGKIKSGLFVGDGKSGVDKLDSTCHIVHDGPVNFTTQSWYPLPGIPSNTLAMPSYKSRAHFRDVFSQPHQPGHGEAVISCDQYLLDSSSTRYCHSQPKRSRNAAIPVSTLPTSEYFRHHSKTQSLEKDEKRALSANDKPQFVHRPIPVYPTRGFIPFPSESDERKTLSHTGRLIQSVITGLPYDYDRSKPRALFPTQLPTVPQHANVEDKMHGNEMNILDMPPIHHMNTDHKGLNAPYSNQGVHKASSLTPSAVWLDAETPVYSQADQSSAYPPSFGLASSQNPSSWALWNGGAWENTEEYLRGRKEPQKHGYFLPSIAPPNATKPILDGLNNEKELTMQNMLPIRPRSGTQVYRTPFSSPGKPLTNDSSNRKMNTLECHAALQAQVPQVRKYVDTEYIQMPRTSEILPCSVRVRHDDAQRHYPILNEMLKTFVKTTIQNFVSVPNPPCQSCNAMNNNMHCLRDGHRKRKTPSFPVECNLLNSTLKNDDNIHRQSVDMTRENTPGLAYADKSKCPCTTLRTANIANLGEETAHHCSTKTFFTPDKRSDSLKVEKENWKRLYTETQPRVGTTQHTWSGETCHVSATDLALRDKESKRALASYTGGTVTIGDCVTSSEIFPDPNKNLQSHEPYPELGLSCSLVPGRTRGRSRKTKIPKKDQVSLTCKTCSSACPSFSDLLQHQHIGCLSPSKCEPVHATDCLGKYISRDRSFLATDCQCTQCPMCKAIFRSKFRLYSHMQRGCYRKSVIWIYQHADAGEDGHLDQPPAANATLTSDACKTGPASHEKMCSEQRIETAGDEVQMLNRAIRSQTLSDTTYVSLMPDSLTEPFSSKYVHKFTNETGNTKDSLKNMHSLDRHQGYLPGLESQKVSNLYQDPSQAHGRSLNLSSDVTSTNVFQSDTNDLLISKTDSHTTQETKDTLRKGLTPAKIDDNVSKISEKILYEKSKIPSINLGLGIAASTPVTTMLTDGVNCDRADAVGNQDSTLLRQQSCTHNLCEMALHSGTIIEHAGKDSQPQMTIQQDTVKQEVGLAHGAAFNDCMNGRDTFSCADVKQEVDLESSLSHIQKHSDVCGENRDWNRLVDGSTAENTKSLLMDTGLEQIVHSFKKGDAITQESDGQHFSKKENTEGVLLQSDLCQTFCSGSKNNDHSKYVADSDLSPFAKDHKKQDKRTGRCGSKSPSKETGKKANQWRNLKADENLPMTDSSVNENCNYTNPHESFALRKNMTEAGRLDANDCPKIDTRNPASSIIYSDKELVETRRRSKGHGKTSKDHRERDDSVSFDHPMNVCSRHKEHDSPLVDITLHKTQFTCNSKYDLVTIQDRRLAFGKTVLRNTQQKDQDSVMTSQIDTAATYPLGQAEAKSKDPVIIAEGFPFKTATAFGESRRTCKSGVRERIVYALDVDNRPVMLVEREGDDPAACNANSVIPCDQCSKVFPTLFLYLWHKRNGCVDDADGV